MVIETKIYFNILLIEHVRYFIRVMWFLQNWTKNSGWKISVSRPKMYPDNKDLNVLYKTKGNQFYVNGFDKSPI